MARPACGSCKRASCSDGSCGSFLPIAARHAAHGPALRPLIPAIVPHVECFPMGLPRCTRSSCTPRAPPRQLGVWLLACEPVPGHAHFSTLRRPLARRSLGRNTSRSHGGAPACAHPDARLGAPCGGAPGSAPQACTPWCAHGVVCARYYHPTATPPPPVPPSCLAHLHTPPKLCAISCTWTPLARAVAHGLALPAWCGNSVPLNTTPVPLLRQGRRRATQKLFKAPWPATVPRRTPCLCPTCPHLHSHPKPRRPQR